MKKILLFTGLYGASAAILKLFNFALILWLAKSFSLTEYASFGLLYALQTGISTFAVAGIFEGMVGLFNQYKNEDQRKKLFNAANSSFFIMATLITIISVLINVIFSGIGAFDFSTLIYVIASGTLLAYSSLQAQIVRLEEKHTIALGFNFLVPTGGLIGAFLALYFNNDITYFFLGNTIGIFIPLLIIFLFNKSSFFISDKNEIKYILQRVLPFVIVSILGWISGYGNNYVVNFLLDEEKVARFTFALSVASIMQMVSTALNQVWAPRFYKITHEMSHDDVEKENNHFSLLSSIILGCIGGLSLAMFPIVIKLTGGNLSNYADMGFELFVLFAAYITLLVWSYCFNYLLVYDHGKQIMKIVIVTSIIGILIWLILIIFFGEIGVYVGFFIQMLMRSMAIYLVARKKWKLNISWIGLIISIVLTFGGYLLSKFLY